MSGDVHKPRPVMQRVAEAFWGYDFLALLALPAANPTADQCPTTVAGSAGIEHVRPGFPSPAKAGGDEGHTALALDYSILWRRTERPRRIVGRRRTVSAKSGATDPWGRSASVLARGGSWSVRLDGPAADDEVENSVQRRILLQQTLAALAVGAIPALDAVRQSVAMSMPRRASNELDVAEWASVAYDREHAYYTQAPGDLILDLAADLADLQHDLGGAGERARRDLSRVVSLLAALMAMSLVNLGQFAAARRWWRTARHAADASTDTAVRVLVRSQDATHAIYEQRPLALALKRADEAIAISGTSVYAGTAEAVGARAQMLALMGRAGEARASIEHLSQVFNRLTAAVTGSATILSGWPQRRLWHTTSYVHTQLGDAAQAEPAQQQALALIPSTAPRSRAQVQLHVARCLVRAGHITDGARHAGAVYTALPAEQRTALVNGVARQVLDAIPGTERSRPVVKDLDELLIPPTYPGI